ncbi:MAG: hypothetical protein JSV63_02590 [Candidatus Aenigmatarchaeota archaeon]|nr:MAG: hypothetical protein JSV63_02590 [Candidatus Aenigmarchaeota archaeon]
MKEKNFMILAVVLIITLSSAVYIVVSQPKEGKYDEFAQCLTESGAAMYGTSWCSHCNDQKNMFGQSFSYIDFTDCDASDLCREAGVRAYPTWIINGVHYTGSKSLQELSSLSGCSLE